MRPVTSWICACRQPTVRAVRRDARLRGREDTFRRRVLIGACLGGAALLLALLACEAFGSAPPPEAQVRPLSFWRQVRRHTSETFGFVFFFAPLVAVWGFSVHIRCSERLIRRPLKTVAVLVVLWLVVVLVKYRCVTQNQQLIALLWYLYYVPMTLIPLLCLVCAFRAAGIDHLRPVCVFEKALVAASVAAVALVLTNSLHHLVFSFNFADPLWQDHYTYRWGYWVLVSLYVGEYLGYFIVLFSSATRRRRAALALITFSAFLVGVYFLLYILRSVYTIRTNFSLAYCATVILLLEISLDLGVLPSSLWYRDAFAGLPLDLKVLTPQNEVAFETDVAGPLPENVAEMMEYMRRQAAGGMAQYRTSLVPHTLFKSYRVSGGTALITEDVTSIDERRDALLERQERLRRSNAALVHEGRVRHELWQLESERRLLQEVKDAISDKIGRMNALLADLPQGDGPEERARRREMLIEVKFLVAYCKRKGALVISRKGDPDFDRDRLQLVFNETASDLRSVGVNCAVVVDVDRQLPVETVHLLYDCLYDTAVAAFFARDPILMIFVRERGERVEMRVALDSAEVDTDRIEQISSRLRQSLREHDATLLLESSPTSLNAVMSLPVAAEGPKGGGAL